MNIPAREARRKIGGFAKHAVTFVWSGNREADALNLRPVQIVLHEKIRDADDPAADDGVASFFSRPLKQFGGHGLATLPDGGKFGGGCAAVRPDKDVFAHVRDLKLRRTQ